MTINNISSTSMLQVQSLVRMRQQLDDLHKQLDTGKKSTDYAGLGIDRSLTIGLRTQLSAATAYSSSIDVLGTRLQLAQTALTDIQDAARVVKSSLPQTSYVLDGSGRTTEQDTAHSQLDRLLAALSSQFGDQYIFSGQATDKAPVATLDQILGGDGARAGFRQIMSERNQADLGATGLGRLVIPAAAANTVSVSEDGSVFGFKLDAIATTIAGVTPSVTAGPPKSMAVDLTAATIAPGDSVTLTLALPDGSKEKIVLTATTDSPPRAGQFTIGADAAASSNNLQAALTTAVRTQAQTSLAAASAFAAANDFFNIDAANPPRRVNGPPFDTATSLIAGTSANTVSWYTGEAGSQPARSTATARIGTSLAVSYGMRANEQALRSPVATLAVFAAMSFSASDVNGQGRYTALTQRMQSNLSDQPGTQKIIDIAAELGGTQAAMAAAKDRHTQTSAALTDLLQEVQGVNLEEVGAQILAMQTSLQASLQTTARLADLSLVNYL